MRHFLSVFPLAVAFFSLFLSNGLAAQEKQYKVGLIGFYNVENLFDTKDDENFDEEFLPDGTRQWTEEKYNEKLRNMAKVISDIGTDMSPDGLAIMGVAEVENRGVLEDLVRQEAIKDRNYQIVHYESPDKRGIDCALIYNPKYFTITETAALNVPLKKENGEPKYTRDILFVKGVFDGDTIHVLVNHWPSRSGGELRSRPFRNIAAQVAKDTINNILAHTPNAKVFVMGDLNDDPTSPSVKEVMKGERKKKKVKGDKMYNPMHNFYRKGLGTLAWRDAWNVFDQILMTPGCLDMDGGGYFYHKAQIFNKPYLVQKTGQYKGYPFRTFAGSEYQGGYADHFPVYVVLLKEVP